MPLHVSSIKFHRTNDRLKLSITCKSQTRVLNKNEEVFTALYLNNESLSSRVHHHRQSHSDWKQRTHLVSLQSHTKAYPTNEHSTPYLISSNGMK